MKARPKAALVLKIMIPTLVAMVPIAAFGVALDYNISCDPILGCFYNAPKGFTDCGYAANPTYANYAPKWLQEMSKEFAGQVNAIPGYGSGYEKIGVYDSNLIEVCSKSFNSRCSDQARYPGINTQYVGLLALHGSSSPFTNPMAPTFNLYFASYPTSNMIPLLDNCGPQMFGKMYLGLPTLKFLFLLSCDSMNVSNDIPSAAVQQNGWKENSWGVHIIAGFSGLDHTGSGPGDMDDFMREQKTLGVGHSWMNHFTKFSPTGNDTITGLSDCAVPMMLGNTASDAAGRWTETINSPNAKANPKHPTAAWQTGFYCNCCAAYGLPGSVEGVHCTPSC